MNFKEIYDEVVSITKRPDKILDAKREINKAINFYSIEANFARDRDELLVALDPNLYAQSILLSAFTRFRKIETILVPYTQKPLTMVDPTMLGGSPANSCRHGYYIGGDQLNIGLAQSCSSARIGYFKFPPILRADTDTYWMTDVSPYMIIDRAAAAIFNNIGDDASFRNHKGLADEAYISAKRDYRYGVNHGG